MSSLIVKPEQFKPFEHMLFTKPKVNASGGKSIGILNSNTRRSIQISMLYVISNIQCRREFANEQTDYLICLKIWNKN